MTNSPTCLLTLYFAEAFDKIAHTYLFTVLEHCGFSQTFLTRLKGICTNAISSVQVNGHISLPIAIRSGIRQGCPLSMLLFTICMNPFLCMLDTMLHENKPTAERGKPNVVAYPDDVTIILHSPTDIPKVREALHCYETAIGARLDIRKSKMMGLGTWDESIDILGIPNCNELRILGIQMTKTTNQSAKKSWAVIAGTIHAQAQEAYYKTFNLEQRMMYVENYLLAKAWYVAQIFPPHGDSLRQIRLAIAWYIWRGDIFRAPLTTLCMTRETGGWNLTRVEAKCRTLLINRLQIQSEIEG
jgi:hypothetical protein